MHAFLVVGPGLARKEKVEELLKDEGLSKFSISIFDTQDSHSIDLIRNIKRQLAGRPWGKKRAIVMENAQKLTTEAANAFLKILEEPPADTLIILSAETDDLPATIVSRCQKVIVRGKVEDLTKQKEIFEKLTSAGVGERIEFIENVGKSRQEAQDFCRGQLLYLRKLLITSSQKELLGLTRRLLKTLELLSQNVNPKMLLFELVMRYPKTS